MHGTGSICKPKDQYAYFCPMILEQLHTVFEFKDAPVLKENPTGNFSIRCIRPANCNIQLIITDGLSAYQQPVTERSKSYERIELYFCLPEYWDLGALPWPVEWLNRIAAVPQKNKTWFAPGDTLPAGNPPEFLDDQFQASYFILSPPELLAPEFGQLEKNEPSIRFLAVIPIFQKEFEYKTQNSGTLLLAKLKAKGLEELVDRYRKPLARRRFMGYF